ncbi:hypothetical protein D9B85_15360, partial [Corynebacterium diphtheriae]
ATRPGRTASSTPAPYVFLPEPLALYRDLTEGDSGRDVSSLQRALEKVGHTAGKDGVLDARTVRVPAGASRPLPGPHRG